MHLTKRRALRAATVATLLGATTAWAGQRPTTMESCKLCHPPADTVVRGKLVSVAPAQKSLSVSVGGLVWIVKYDDGLEVKEGAKLGGPAALKGLPRDRELAVTFSGPETRPVATQVAVKQPYKLPPEKVLPVERMKELVAGGTGPGKVFLFDSRPPAMFDEGHIPGAVSLPFGAFKAKAAAVLPPDKGALVVFYCAGDT
jgi:hypothetical protein